MPISFRDGDLEMFPMLPKMESRAERGVFNKINYDHLKFLKQERIIHIVNFEMFYLICTRHFIDFIDFNIVAKLLFKTKHPRPYCRLLNEKMEVELRNIIYTFPSFVPVVGDCPLKLLY